MGGVSRVARVCGCETPVRNDTWVRVEYDVFYVSLSYLVVKERQWALTEPWRDARGALAIPEHTQTYRSTHRHTIAILDWNLRG